MAGNIQFTNNASTTLASSILVGATSLTVAAATGSLFPTLAGSQYFYCTLINTAGTVLEIVKVTARSTDTFTIVRAQDGTTASAFASGDKVELRIVAADMNNLPQLDSTNTFAAVQTFSAGITSTATPVGITSGGTGAATAAGANANIQTYTTTATAAGTTTLTNTSTYYQYFTGVTTQTVVLPVTSTLSLGWSFHIANNSTGNLTLQSSGLNTIATILPNTTAHITCILTSGTTAASWDYGFTDFNTSVPVALGGTGSTTLTANNVLLGNGTSALQVVAPGTTGNVLTSNGTTWQSTAAGGGLGGVTVYAFAGTASRAVGVMTVSAVTNGIIHVGDTITSTGGTSFGVVSSFGTGTGGAGTYNMSTSGTIASTTVYASAATFTIPTGKTVVKVTIIGAGGGVGGMNGYCCNNINTSGGSSGGASVKYLTSLTPGNTLTVALGAGGTAGTGSTTPTTGGTGGTSSVASGTQTITTVSATGGAGSVGRFGGSTTYNGGIGAPGTGSGGDLNINGNPGYQAGYAFPGQQSSNRGGVPPILGGNGSIDVTYSSSSAIASTAGSFGAGGTSGQTSGNMIVNGALGGPGIVIFEY